MHKYWMQVVNGRIKEVLASARLSSGEAADHLKMTGTQTTRMLRGELPPPMLASVIHLNALLKSRGVSVSNGWLAGFDVLNGAQLEPERLADYREFFLSHLDFFEYVFTAINPSLSESEKEEQFRLLVSLEFFESPPAGNTPKAYEIWRKLVGQRLRVAIYKPRFINGAPKVYTLNEVASKMRTTNLSFLLSGERPLPSLQQGLAAAKFLNVDPRWLLGMDFIEQHIHERDLIRHRDALRLAAEFVRIVQSTFSVSPRQAIQRLDSDHSQVDPIRADILSRIDAIQAAVPHTSPPIDPRMIELMTTPSPPASPPSTPTAPQTLLAAPFSFHNLPAPSSITELYRNWRQLVAKRIKALVYPPHSVTRHGFPKAIVKLADLANALNVSTSRVADLMEGHAAVNSTENAARLAVLLGISSPHWLLGLDYISDYIGLFEGPEAEEFYKKNEQNRGTFRTIVATAKAKTLDNSMASLTAKSTPGQCDVFPPPRR